MVLLSPEIEFEELLVLNYERTDDEECKRRVAEFLDCNPNVHGEDIHFIEMVLKAADNLVRNDVEFIRPNLERIYHLNMEAARYADDYRGLAGGAYYGRMLSNFLRFAGDAAFEMLLSQQNKEWGERAFEAFLDSARVIEREEPVSAAYQYGFAGTASQKLANITRNPDWFERMYSSSKRAVELIGEANPEHKAHLYEDVGRAARGLSRTKGGPWLNKWYENSRMAADMALQLGICIAGENYRSAGMAAESLAGNDAGGKAVWLDRARNCYSAIIDHRLPTCVNPIDVKILLGDINKALYRETFDRAAARDAVDVYRAVLSSFNEKPSSGLKDKMSRIAGDIECLERILLEPERIRAFYNDGGEDLQAPTHTGALLQV